MIKLHSFEYEEEIVVFFFVVFSPREDVLFLSKFVEWFLIITDMLCIKRIGADKQ